MRTKGILALWLGRSAEARAARHLRSCGLRVIARNVRAGRGEIDILARAGGLVVVVEVRRRKGGILAADLSVTREKARHVQAAWSAVCRRYRLPRGLPVRFDLVLLGEGREIVHVPDALGDAATGPRS